jgi:acetylornithine deacetylase/succinyl-diaminopimelate desuccinylase-like protein
MSTSLTVTRSPGSATLRSRRSGTCVRPEALRATPDRWRPIAARYASRTRRPWLAAGPRRCHGATPASPHIARPPPAPRLRDAAGARDDRGDRRGGSAGNPDRAPGCCAHASPDAVLDRLGQRAKFFDPLLHNTASPTIVRGGRARNVIPGEVSVDLDCRLLPGFGPEDASRELRQLAGVEIETEVRRFDPGPPRPDMSLLAPHSRTSSSRPDFPIHERPVASSLMAPASGLPFRLGG